MEPTLNLNRIEKLKYANKKDFSIKVFVIKAVHFSIKKVHKENVSPP